MKEFSQLSIEQKAKAYDEAKLRMRIAFNSNRCTINFMNEIFPELKESEDEKIRKGIISGMVAIKGQGKETFAAIRINDCIAWLEKQGEQKQDPCEHCKMTYSTCYSFPCDEKKAFEQGKSALEAINEENVDNADKVGPKDYSSIDPHFGKPIDKVEPKFKVKYAGNEYNVLEVKDVSDVTFYGIEDEPNHIDYVKAENCERVDGYSIKENGSTYPTKSAVFSEQTIIDKVEPKFKQGQWIVWKDKCYEVNYNGCGYELIDQNGLSTSLEYGTIDENAHLWTIKDAKDGDILASKSGNKIFSYRGSLDLKGNPCAYYGIYKVHDGICFSPCAIGNSFTCEEVFPATKEQCKILFEEKTAAKGVLHFNKKELI